MREEYVLGLLMLVVAALLTWREAMPATLPSTTVGMDERMPLETSPKRVGGSVFASDAQGAPAQDTPVPPIATCPPPEGTPPPGLYPLVRIRDVVIFQERLPDGCPTARMLLRVCLENDGPSPSGSFPMRIQGCGIGRVEVEVPDIDTFGQVCMVVGAAGLPPGPCEIMIDPACRHHFFERYWTGSVPQPVPQPTCTPNSTPATPTPTASPSLTPTPSATSPPSATRWQTATPAGTPIPPLETCPPTPTFAATATPGLFPDPRISEVSIVQVFLSGGCPTDKLQLQVCVDNRGPAPTGRLPLRLRGCSFGLVDIVMDDVPSFARACIFVDRPRVPTGPCEIVLDPGCGPGHLNRYWTGPVLEPERFPPCPGIIHLPRLESHR